MKRLTAVLALVMLPAGAQAGSGCEEISRHFQFCPAGSAWEQAEWHAQGDMTDIVLNGVTFWYSEDWLGRRGTSSATPAAALSALLAEAEADGDRREVLRRDELRLAGRMVAREIARLEPAGAAPVLRATMIAGDAGEGMIMLIVEAAATHPFDEIDARAREIATLVRPVQE